MTVTVLHTADATGNVAAALRDLLTLLAESGPPADGVWPIRVVTSLPQYFARADDAWLRSLNLLEILSDNDAVTGTIRGVLQADMERRRNASVTIQTPHILAVASIHTEFDAQRLLDIVAPIQTSATQLIHESAVDEVIASEWGDGTRLLVWAASQNAADNWPPALFERVAFLRPVVMAHTGPDGYGRREIPLLQQRLVNDLLLVAGLSAAQTTFDAVFPFRDNNPTVFLSNSVRVESHAHLRAREQMIGNLLGTPDSPGLLPNPSVSEPVNGLPQHVDDKMQSLARTLRGLHADIEPDVSRYLWPDGASRPAPNNLFAQLDEIGPDARDGSSLRSWPVLSAIRWHFVMPERQMNALQQKARTGVARAESVMRREVFQELENRAAASRDAVFSAARAALRAPAEQLVSRNLHARDLAQMHALFEHVCAKLLQQLEAQDEDADQSRSPESNATTALALHGAPSAEASLLAERFTVPSASAAYIEAAALASIGLYLAALTGWTVIGAVIGCAAALIVGGIALWLRSRQLTRHLRDWQQLRDSAKSSANAHVERRVKALVDSEKSKGRTSLRSVAAAVRQSHRRWNVELRGARAHFATVLAATRQRRSAAQAHLPGANGIWIVAGRDFPNHVPSEVASVALSHFTTLTGLTGMPPAPRVAAYDSALVESVTTLLTKNASSNQASDPTVLAAVQGAIDTQRLTSMQATEANAQALRRIFVAGTRFSDVIASGTQNLQLFPDTTLEKSNAMPADIFVGATILAFPLPHEAK